MRVVIEIDEERYTDIQRLTSVQLDDCRFKTTELIIANGIPLESVLEDIKAELTNLADADAYGDYQFGVNFGLMRASQIIDKYMRGKDD